MLPIVILTHIVNELLILFFIKVQPQRHEDTKDYNIILLMP